MHDESDSQGDALTWLATLFDHVSRDDSGLGDHCRRVSSLAMQMTRSVSGEGHELLDVMVTASRVHDIGKLAIPVMILDKPGRLTNQETMIVRRHAVIGASLLTLFGATPAVTAIVRHHHEWWNGAGYPDGLAGEAIPLGARIIAICDAFDAMTSDRPYRRARTIDEALHELEQCAGMQFDPDLVRRAAEQFQAEHWSRK